MNNFMTLKETQEKIVATQNEVTEIVSKLDRLAANISIEAKSFFPIWFEKTTRQAISDNALLVSEMPVGALSELKSEINQIETKCSQLVDAELDQPDAWPHKLQVAASAGNVYESEREAQKSVDESVRKITGYLGAILRKYKLTKMEPGWWKAEQTYGGISSVIANYNYYHSTPLDQAISEYSKVYKDYFQAIVTLDDLKRTEEKQAALELYDKA